MSAERKDPRFQDARDLAGPAYQEMARSRKDTLRFLSSADPAVRLAAVLTCITEWNCGADSSVVEACIDIAGSNAGDGFRVCAASLLGTILSSSQAAGPSQFLAKQVLAPANSVEVRIAAYWALREIRFGLSDVSFDEFLKGFICTSVQPFVRENPEVLSAVDAHSVYTPAPGFPRGFWNSASNIDWDFVRQFVQADPSNRKP